ncbi:hypothetical protein JCM10212_003091 [Sporobolomyces blumeae]
MSPPPAYEPVPSTPDLEKPPLSPDGADPSSLSFARDSGRARLSRRSTTSRLVVALLVTSFVLGSLTMILVASTCLATHHAGIRSAWSPESGAQRGGAPPNGVTEPETTTTTTTTTVTDYVQVTKQAFDLGAWKWWNKRDDEGSGDATYSTSTLRDGSTQTFVFTTRPIVNPGGYTIGTLTGYVPVPTTTTTTTTTTGSTPAPDTESPIPLSTSRPRSTLPASHAASLSSTVTTQASASDVESTSWHLVSTTTLPPRPTASASNESGSSGSGPVSTGIASSSGEFNFDDTVNYHLLYRRGLDFEEVPEPKPALSPTSSATDAVLTSTPTQREELSTSTDRKGSLYTLVKTTRPILNPAGFTIGTLNGAWVDVAKQTDRAPSSSSLDPTRAPLPSSSSSPTATNPVPGRKAHEELRKRYV